MSDSANREVILPVRFITDIPLNSATDERRYAYLPHK